NQNRFSFIVTLSIGCGRGRKVAWRGGNVYSRCVSQATENKSALNLSSGRPAALPQNCPNHAWIVEEGQCSVNVTSVMQPGCRKSPFAGSFGLHLEQLGAVPVAYWTVQLWPPSEVVQISPPAVPTVPFRESENSMRVIQ